MKKTSLSLAFAAIAAITAFPVYAGVLTQTDTVIYTSTPGPLTGFSLTPNLMDQATILSTTFGASVGGSSPTVLVPASPSYGTVDWGYTFNGAAASSAISGGGNPQNTPYQVVFQLNPVGAVKGYDLTGINVMSSWDNPISQAQNYDLAYSLASAPTVFISLGNYTLTGANTTSQSMETSLSGILMPNHVADLKFTFNDLGTDFTQATRRIEVFGAVDVPEPSTYAMLVLGMGVLAIGIRRRQLSS